MRGPFKAKAWVIRRMPQDNHEWTASISEMLKPVTDKFRADALALIGG